MGREGGGNHVFLYVVDEETMNDGMAHFVYCI